MRILAVILGLALLVVGYLRYEKAERGALIERYAPPPGPVSEELPRMWLLPDFQLTERSGKATTLGSLRGQVWIADFFYTTCPGPCPMLSSRFSELQQELGGEADLRLVSISTDPEKDTPEQLQKYAAHFHAGGHWLFLTGDKPAIYELANKGFKLSLVEDPNNAAAPIDHSTKLALVDRTGTVRGVYDGLTVEGKGKLLRDARRLLAEKL